MVHIYLVYGLAFVLLASVTAFQLGTSVRILPTAAMVLLSLFGLIHGSAEWVEIAKYFPHVDVTPIQRLSAGLVFTSYVALFGFGLELVLRFKRLPRALSWLTPAAALIAGVVAYGMSEKLAGSVPAFTVWDITARYLLAFPGSVLSSLGLHAAASARTGQLEVRLRGRLRWAGTFFGIYAVFASAIVPEAPFGPAAILNARVFSDFMGFPVVVIRMFCALGISLALVQAFVVEISRLNTLWGRMREEFVSLVAHDLKSSLTAVKLASELLVEEIPEARQAPERIERIARQILSTTTSLGRIVGDLLDASLIAADRITLRRQKVNLTELVSAAVERVREDFTQCEIRVDVPSNALFASVDPVRLDQILLNLLSNAQKYAKPGNPVRVSLAEKPLDIVFSLRNKVENLDLSELPLLFERYYRRKTTAGRTQGSGLGLYIVKGLVAAHGGQAEVRSLGQDEIEFSVSFPKG